MAFRAAFFAGLRVAFFAGLRVAFFAGFRAAFFFFAALAILFLPPNVCVRTLKSSPDHTLVISYLEHCVPLYVNSS